MVHYLINRYWKSGCFFGMTAYTFERMSKKYAMVILSPHILHYCSTTFITCHHRTRCHAPKPSDYPTVWNPAWNSFWNSALNLWGCCLHAQNTNNALASAILTTAHSIQWCLRIRESRIRGKWPKKNKISFRLGSFALRILNTFHIWVHTYVIHFTPLIL